jgi:cellobiose phosphorylase
MAFATLADRERAWELTQMINPVNHARTPEGRDLYKVEPYVVAADVYAVAPHTGRGGWTWYTGSAGWMYRLIVESLLGLVREHDRLRFAPCIPAHWPQFTLRYTYGSTVYAITVVQSLAEGGAESAPVEVNVDGVTQGDGWVRLVDDAIARQVTVAVRT